MRTILFALVLATSTIAFLPSAEAANGSIQTQSPCPGIVCYGTGSHYGYLVCVGPGYCDPAACEPFFDLCDHMDNCEILGDP